MSHDWSNQRKRLCTSNYSYHLMPRPWQSLTASYIKWLVQCTNIDIQSDSRNLTSCELWEGVDWPIFWDGGVFRGALERLGSKLSKTPLKNPPSKKFADLQSTPLQIDNLSNFLPRTVHNMFKFSWTKCNIFLRRLFAFTFSCLRFYKETVSVKLRQIELNVILFVWLFSLKMAKKIRHIKEIKYKWKECLGSLEGTKLFVHNISKETSPDYLDSAVSEHGWTLMLT